MELFITSRVWTGVGVVDSHHRSEEETHIKGKTHWNSSRGEILS